VDDSIVSKGASARISIAVALRKEHTNHLVTKVSSQSFIFAGPEFCFETFMGRRPDLMYFAFKWKHRDGFTIEFSPEGWHSDGPVKADWLKLESEFLDSWPLIPKQLRTWLQQNCELIEFQSSRSVKNPKRELMTCVQAGPADIFPHRSAGEESFS
jgi:hypothetical protein